MQQASVREYKQKPMLPEVRQKVELSYTESLDLTDRELRCPHCGYYIMTLCSDVSGHLKAKCNKCKAVTTYNLGYFRRSRRKGRTARIERR